MARSLFGDIGIETFGSGCPKPLSVSNPAIKDCHLYGFSNIAFSDIYPDHIQFYSAQHNTNLYGYLPTFGTGKFHKGSKTIRDVGEIKYFYYASHNGFITFGGNRMTHGTRYRINFGDDLQWETVVTTYVAGSLLAELRDSRAIAWLAECNAKVKPFKLRVRLA